MIILMPTNDISNVTNMPLPPIERQLLNIAPHPQLQIETHLVEHCNLNCRMCTHFSPLAHPHYASIEIFSRDMQRLKDLFSNCVSYIMLLGGEPLLHPQLTEFLDTARMFFPSTKVILYTNGLMIPKLKDAFWESCRKNNIIITLTRYPVAIDYNLINHLLDEHDLTYSYCNTPGREKKLSHYPLDLSGKQDPRKSFLKCDMANRCIFLREGRLYTCPLIPNIHHFNEFFQQELQVSPSDFIDIYKAKSATEIMHFLATPTSFCRYCDVPKRTILHDWNYSKKDIGEWT